AGCSWWRAARWGSRSSGKRGSFCGTSRPRRPGNCSSSPITTWACCSPPSCWTGSFCDTLSPGRRRFSMSILTTIAHTVRVLAADAVEKAQSGHPGLPLVCAEIGTALFAQALRHDPAAPQWPNRDRFVLSAGHGSMLLYALLHLSGYDLPMEELQRFRQLGSRTPGHPEYGITPGVETTTGPL